MTVSPSQLQSRFLLNGDRSSSITRTADSRGPLALNLGRPSRMFQELIAVRVGLQVVGGRFGFDFRVGQPSPTVAGATLTNQSCAAVVYLGRGPLTLVGAALSRAASTTSPDSPCVLCVGLTAEAFVGECELPNVPELGWTGVSTFSGSLSLVDSTVLYSASPPTTPTGRWRSRLPRTRESPPSLAILFNRSVYIANSFFRGFSAVAATPDRPASPVLNASVWMVVDEMAVATVPPPLWVPVTRQEYRYQSPRYGGGVRVNAEDPWVASPAREAIPPPSLQAKHAWDETLFPSFQSAQAVNAKAQCGVVGDGVTDDAPALQRCVDTHLCVLLPKGFYRLGATLRLEQPGAALVGVGRTVTVLMPTHTGFQGGPMLRVMAPNATVSAHACVNPPVFEMKRLSTRLHQSTAELVNFQLFQLSYVSFWHQPDAWLLDWASTASGVWRQSHGYRMCDLLAWGAETGSWMRSCSGYPMSMVTAGTLPMTVISGGGRFYR